jgi:hypothetical protein
VALDAIEFGERLGYWSDALSERERGPAQPPRGRGPAPRSFAPEAAWQR